MFLCLRFLTEYFLNLSLIFGACRTIDKIFRYKIKKYTIFILAAAFLEPVLSQITSLFSADIENTYRMLLSPEECILVYSLMIWIFVTDKKPKMLAVTTAASMFSSFITYSTSSLSEELIKYVSGTNTIEMYLSLVVLFFSDFLAVIFIVMIGYIGKSKIKEPMSVWNMYILAISVYLASWYMLVQNDKSDSHLSVILGFVLIIFAAMMAVKNTENRYYIRISEGTENYIKSQKNYYDSRLKADREIRSIKHDMKNHLICISDLCEKAKYEELKDYVSELSERLNTADQSVRTGNDIADVIINDKISKTLSDHITINVSGTMDRCTAEPIDICTIMSNLIDNAVDAVKKLPEEYRKIEIEFKNNLHFILISVRNPSENYVGTFSTVKDDKENHGFGISNINLAVEKYGGESGFSCEKGEKNYIFTANIMIPKNYIGN